MAVMKTLNNKLPKATRFFDALPPIALTRILMIVPVSPPNTIAAAIGNPIAPAFKALNVSAMVTELD